MEMDTVTMPMAVMPMPSDNPNRWRDSDNDGVADEDDAFVNDPSQSSIDGDRFGDNPNGTNLTHSLKMQANGEMEMVMAMETIPTDSQLMQLNGMIRMMMAMEQQVRKPRRFLP